MKRCGGCNTQKPLTEFYRHTRDGYQARCKACKRIENRIRSHQPTRKAYNKRKWQEWWQTKSKAYYAKLEVKARRAELMRRYANDSALRLRHMARWITNRAIKSGRLERKPCEVCGMSKTQAHHQSYFKPLEVNWLCLVHHRERHAKAEGKSDA